MRKLTRVAKIGAVEIGGSNPIAIQSMTNTDTRDVLATVRQIEALAAAGCEIVRLAVPDDAAALAFGEIRKRVSDKIPLVADIHFDWRLAVKSAEAGADKLRINPGNIGGIEKVKEVARAAKERKIPIRIGVNSGSLEKELLAKHGGPTPLALAESALAHAAMLESCGFYDIVISIKASSVPTCIEACKILSEKTDYPQHIGITESGTAKRGAIKSAVGIGALLAQGIGDTIRVSLTADPVEEVAVAREILMSLALRSFGVEFVSCPTCGRTEIDLMKLALIVEEKCKSISAPLKVAVMGCVVNGPGEARDADIGVAGGKGKGAIFKKGKILRTVDEPDLASALLLEIEKLAAEAGGR
ncbi:MAG: flavodoxin-dependent (E)-4-hydroxy-3-methylbut-2-enyl-diphosphate synthase [Clostridiales bacterium]|jgi:(E)-4-hydroxy-3-methylbut-2-enyl-diphosphate synthase|nr:flavodoxin-dependent (E)-4-hydroxy-3-methylbut-2-enyl-diphosphate synthase [Clostridiales bacterium]